MRIAAACLHRGEEPPVASGNGSGTIFFSGCTLRCSFCQNCQLSRGGMGRPVGEDEFADICLSLQEKGAANINLVTGTQFIPSLVSGIETARGRGLVLPVVWNSSGYENKAALELIAPSVDIYLPDLKTLDSSLARRFFKAPDYPQAAREALLFMTSRSDPVFDGDRLLRGTIVRHLVLPGFLGSTRDVLRFYSERLADRALISVMVQYIPITADGTREVPDGRVSEAEYEELLDILEECGIEEGFLQELSQGDEWIPDFSCENPFPADWAVPVWHWRSGFCGV